ncbi:MAG: RluA family pseudouridine synthase [Verrucomicrobiae bacterium]|nr:RluA family pseudouridine synthase [Verrucomicrobiae bacterium]
MNPEISATERIAIVAESRDWCVVNKPGDLVCHPTKKGPASSLIGRLRLHYATHPEARPSFVNRLDRETSGIVLVAKNPSAHQRLQAAMAAPSAEKAYLAIVHGTPRERAGVIEQPLGRHPSSEVGVLQAVVPGGAASATAWRILEEASGFSLLEARPRTGRLHQIRVHLAWLGHPIVGDKLYGPDPRLYLEFIRSGWTSELEKRLLVSRQMLHAARLALDAEGEGKLAWEAPPPPDFAAFYAKAFGKGALFDSGVAPPSPVSSPRLS